MVAAGQEALPGGRDVGLVALKGLARRAVAQRDGQRRHEALVVELLALLGVLEQEDLRVLLRLRVQALAGHVGPHGRQQLDADRGHGGLQHGHRDEHGDDRPVPGQSWHRTDLVLAHQEGHMPSASSFRGRVVAAHDRGLPPLGRPNRACRNPDGVLPTWEGHRRDATCGEISMRDAGLLDRSGSSRTAVARIPHPVVRWGIARAPNAQGDARPIRRGADESGIALGAGRLRAGGRDRLSATAW